jgi:hypothetical protein
MKFLLGNLTLNENGHVNFAKSVLKKTHYCLNYLRTLMT